jgi:hypothetical protein
MASLRDWRAVEPGGAIPQRLKPFFCGIPRRVAEAPLFHVTGGAALPPSHAQLLSATSNAADIHVEERPFKGRVRHPRIGTGL